MIPIPIVGAMIGGAVGGFVAKNALDQFIEDDAKEMYQNLKEEFLDIVMISNLNRTEFNEVIELTFGNKKLPSILRDMYAYGDSREFARVHFVSNAVTNVLSKRKKITNDLIDEGLVKFVESSFEEVTETTIDKVSENNIEEKVTTAGNLQKNKIKKIPIASAVAALAIVYGGFGIYEYIEVKAYNNLVTTANIYFGQGNYDQAIALFNQSLKYNDTENVKNKIKEAEKLKEFKSDFDKGNDLMNNKKYLEAIEQFKKVPNVDERLYKDAENKIQDCIKGYIAQNIQLAMSSIEYTKYDEAYKYLDAILKVDGNNYEANKLMHYVNNAREQLQAEKPQANIAISNSNGTRITEAQAYNLVNSVSHSEYPNSKIEFIGIIKIESSDYIPPEARGLAAYCFDESNDTDTTISNYYVDMQGHVYRNTFSSDGKCVKLR
ncbi:hypothetical protein SDC9_114345 [bioreactor metagenome]|uniref:Uncharacterized protein n=1 Tax=bioreactor metagenome TaxID=1076179 RepID=A0A645BWB2_9ZZZZ